MGLGCASGGKGASAPAEGTKIDGSFTCKGGGDKTWKASFAGTKVDECVVKAKDELLDLRVGTLEEGLTLHLTDFTGSGQYQLPGNGGSKLAVVAKGGVGEATSTMVDTSTADPCKSTCTVEISEAGEGALSIDITCPKLTKLDAGACVTCTPSTPGLVSAHAIACRRE